MRRAEPGQHAEQRVGEELPVGHDAEVGQLIDRLRAEELAGDDGGDDGGHDERPDAFHGDGAEDDFRHGHVQYAMHKIFNEFQAQDYREKFGMTITGVRLERLPALLGAAPGAAMVTAMIRVARTLNFKVIAEQVEDVSTMDAARQMGVDYMQGFAVGRPERMDMAA